MSVEENKEKIRLWFTQGVNGKTDVTTLMTMMDKTISPKFVDHDMPNPEKGAQMLKKLLPVVLKAFPDLQFTIYSFAANR